MNIFSRLSIQSKVMLCLIAVSLISIIVTGYVGYSSGKEVITQEIFDQMTQLRTSRSQQVESYFAYLRNHAISLAEDPTVVEATASFREEFAKLEEQKIPPDWISQLWQFYQKEFIPRLAMNVDGVPSVKTYFPTRPVTKYLQYHYLAANPYPVGEKERLDDPKDGSGYSAVHQRFHPFFREIAERFQYNNLALIDAETGDIIYTVQKGTGFASNFTDGPYATSGVAQLLQTLREKGEKGSFAVADFEPFRPNFGEPGAFVGSPVFAGSNLIGILILHFPVKEINRIMTGNLQWEADGLGKTGETFLVGSDLLLRSQSRLLVENADSYLKELANQRVSPKTIERIRRNRSPILLQEIDSEAVRRALNGETGTDILPDYRGILSLTSYAPLKLAERLDWAIVAKMDASEVFRPIENLSKRIWLSATILVPLVTLFSLLLSRQLVAPIYRLIAGTRKIAAGEAGVVVSVPSHDEFCQLAGSFNQMARNLDADRQALESQIQTNEMLLLKVLPPSIAKRLKQGEERIADTFANVTVLSANIGGFDEGCDRIPAAEAVELLNDMVSAFDDAAERHEVEKISTMGTSYLAASGLFIPRLDRDKSAVDLALEMLRIVRRFGQEQGLNFELHIGIHAGPAVGGLLGKTKLNYSLLGNTARIARLLAIVNTVEGKPNTILVSQGVYDSLQDFYDFASMGEVDVPGQDKLSVWLVE